MSEIWFSSDHHFGHANIIRFCDRPWTASHYPYSPDVDAMNEALIELWNETVAPDDEVYYLGDAVMGKINETLPLIGLLNGTIHLTLGNHDRPHPMHGKKSLGWVKRYIDAGFSSVFTSQVITDGKVSFDLCHFPFESDSHDKDRFTEWRLKRRGRLLICGHVHDAWKVRDDQINVGCDVWDYRPVHFDTIRHELGVV